MFIFDRCRRSSAAVTPVKYKCDSRNLRGTFARSKILLMEKWSLSNPHLRTESHPSAWMDSQKPILNNQGHKSACQYKNATSRYTNKGFSLWRFSTAEYPDIQNHTEMVLRLYQLITKLRTVRLSWRRTVRLPEMMGSSRSILLTNKWHYKAIIQHKDATLPLWEFPMWKLSTMGIPLVVR